MTISAFKSAPPFAQGVQGGAANRAKQPFGQAPAFEGDGARMFGSGAIVLHFAEQPDVLMPKDTPGPRACDDLGVRARRADGGNRLTRRLQLRR